MTRTFFERGFARDLAHVRVHSGPGATSLTDAIDAHAFTYGNHIWLGAGQQHDVNWVMAHELAHVVQQTQPRELGSLPADYPESSTPAVSKDAQPHVRRVAYWAIREAGGRARTGTRIQRELGLADTWGVDSEAPIPNASRNAEEAEYGQRGRADYYEAAHRIGIYFLEPAPEGPHVRCGDRVLGTPARLYGAMRAGHPRLTPAGDLSRVDSAPSTINLGELKPVDDDSLDLGRRQLAAYEAGIRFAAEQTNCLMAQRGETTQRWNLASVGRINRSIPANWNYAQNEGKSNERLVLARYYANERVHVVFDPERRGLPPIMGGLYAVNAGDGLYGHFARPANPAAVVSGVARGLDPRAAAREATWVQDRLLQPLLQAPTSMQLLRRRSEIPITERDPAFVVRLVRRRRRLQDPFDQSALRDWERDRRTYRQRWTGPSGEDTRSQLELIELAFDAEETLGRVRGVPQPSAGRLPPRSARQFRLGTAPTAGGRRPGPRDVTRLHGWLEVWAMPPMRLLGPFRRRFGRGFVLASRRFEAFRARMAQRIAQRRRRAERGGRSYPAMAVRALWRVVTIVGREVLTETMSLLADSLAAGVQRRLEALLSFDDVDALRERLTQCGENIASCFPELAEPLTAAEEFSTEVNRQIDTVAGQIETYLRELDGVADVARSFGDIIKLAVIAIQCGSPPGWGCFKLILSEVNRRIVERILQNCTVQGHFRDLAESMFDFQRFPRRLASSIADVLEGVLPESIVPIFDRSVFESATLGDAPLECEDEELQEAYRGMIALEEEYGPEFFESLLELLETFGVEGTEALTPEIVERLAATLAETGLTNEQIRDFLHTHERPEDMDEEIPFDDFLRGVAREETAARQMAEQRRLQAGEYDEQLTQLANDALYITFEPSTTRFGRQAGRPALYKDASGRGAAGTATVELEADSLDCDAGTIMSVLSDIVLFYDDGTRVELPDGRHSTELNHPGLEWLCR